MKLTMKNIFVAAAALTAMMAACTQGEEVALGGYSDSALDIEVAGTSPAASIVTVNAAYTLDGKLVLDGALSREFNLHLTSARPTETRVVVTPFVVGIPSDKVEFTGGGSFTIPAGEIAIPTLGMKFLDENFDFAAADKEARIYEIGFRITDVQGGAVSGLGGEAKVVVKKEAYGARVLVAQGEGRKKEFKRTWRDGAIVEDAPISYRFNVELDRPAAEDVKITFAMEGLDQKFAQSWSVAPAETVIKKGELLPAEAIEWTIANDFLLADDQPGEFKLALRATVSSADKYVHLAAGADAIELTVKKSCYGSNIYVDNAGGRNKTFDRSIRNGAIVGDPGTMEHSFVVTLDRAATKDVTVEFSMAGLPEKFADTWSATPAKVVIPAGKTQSETVVLAIDDKIVLDPSAPDRNELKLKAAFASDDKYVYMAPGADVINIYINRSAYSGLVSIDNDGGRAPVIFRGFRGGEASNADPIVYSFRANVNRAAVEDVALEFALEGLPAGFENAWSLSEPVVIPAGQTASNKVELVIKDDFLKADPAAAKDFALRLTGSLKGAGSEFTLDANRRTIEITVRKVRDLLSQVTEAPENWTALAGNAISDTNAGFLFDGNAAGTYAFLNNASVTVNVTLDGVRTIRGFGTTGYYNQSRYNITNINVEWSADGTTWETTVPRNLERAGWVYVAIAEPIKARYLRLTLGATGVGAPTELSIFE